MSVLKQKGKGAKPKRSKLTQDEAIRRAVDQNTRAPRAVRKSGKVRSYTFKEPGERHRGSQEAQRAPKVTQDLSELDLFAQGLPESFTGDPAVAFQMECPHEGESATAGTTSLDGFKPLWMWCPRCKLTRRWWGTKAATNQAEWQTYRVQTCPRAISMEEWGKLYTPDKSMWFWIVEEVKAELQEEANGA